MTIFRNARSRVRLLVWAIASILSWGVRLAPAQTTPACQFRGSLTSATTGVPYTNNTTNPNCNSWALTWTSKGFTALTIQLEGADSSTGAYTAFTGASTVQVGTNPASTLSGTIIVQASSTNAYLRVNVTSVTGTGKIDYQVYGYNGVTPTAKSAGGTCAALGGDLSGTCSAAVVTGVNGAAVPASTAVLATNGSGQIVAGTPGFTNPMSALGDMIYGGAAGAPSRLPGTTAGNLMFLSQQGDGTNSAEPAWIILPLSGNANYYLTPTASDIATYKQMTVTPYAPATTLTYAGLTGTTTTTLQNFATLPLVPNTTFLAAGSYLFYVYASRTNFFTGSVTLRCQFVEVTAAGVDIAVIGASSVTPNLTGTEVEYIVEYNDPNAYTLASTTSRIVARVQAVVATTVASTVSVFIGTSAESRVSVPITGSVSGVSAVTATGPITSTGGWTPNISATYQGTAPTMVQGAIGATVTGDVLKYDATGNAIDGGYQAGNAVEVNGAVITANQHGLSSNASGQLVASTAHDTAVPLTCAAASSSATAYTCSTTPTFVPAARDLILFCPDLANSGAATLVVNGQAGTPAIQKQQGQAALVANDLRASPACVTMEFNATNWVMQGQLGNASGTGTVTSVFGNSGPAVTSVLSATITNPAGTFLISPGTGTGTLDNIYIGGGGVSNTTGNNNVALGYQALLSVTSSVGNTAIGSLALNGITTTAQEGNTAVGYQALTNVSSGANTAVGYNAAESLNGGNNATAVGYSALANDSSGSSNTAVGYTSCTNCKGGFNTAVGAQALGVGSGTTATTHNSAFGNNALENNTTASYNTGAGDSALLSNTTGAYNTALGYQAGYNAGTVLATDSYCTFLGYLANASVDALTNCTALGNGAQVTASNQVQIGNASVTDVYMGGGYGTSHVGSITAYNPTATSGVTKAAIQDGAGQSTTPSLRVVNNAGTGFSVVAHGVIGSGIILTDSAGACWNIVPAPVTGALTSTSVVCSTVP